MIASATFRRRPRSAEPLGPDPNVLGYVVAIKTSEFYSPLTHASTMSRESAEKEAARFRRMGTTRDYLVCEVRPAT